MISEPMIAGRGEFIVVDKLRLFWLVMYNGNLCWPQLYPLGKRKQHCIILPKTLKTSCISQKILSVIRIMIMFEGQGKY